MYIYIYISLSLYIYIYIYVYLSLSLSLYIYIYTYVYIPNLANNMWQQCWAEFPDFADCPPSFCPFTITITITTAITITITITITIAITITITPPLFYSILLSYDRSRAQMSIQLAQQHPVVRTNP